MVPLPPCASRAAKARTFTAYFPGGSVAVTVVGASGPDTYGTSIGGLPLIVTW